MDVCEKMCIVVRIRIEIETRNCPIFVMFHSLFSNNKSSSRKSFWFDFIPFIILKMNMD